MPGRQWFSRSMQVSSDEVHELLSGILIFEECSGEFGRGSHGVLLLDASHRHAEVLRLNDNGHAKRIQHFLQAVLDLRGEPFL